MLTPLETLFDHQRGRSLALPARLAKLYGVFRMPAAHRRPYLYSNFVTSLDGVVSLGVRGHSGGADISGSNAEDRMVMGLLRAVADVVLIGAGTLQADPLHLWTAEGICPELAADFRALRASLRKPPTPLNIIVSGSGRIEATLPVFSSGRVRALVLTTVAGGRVLARRPGSGAIQLITSAGPRLSPVTILREISQLDAGNRILLEGGPHLLGEFYAQRLVDAQRRVPVPELCLRAGQKRIHGAASADFTVSVMRPRGITAS